MLALLTETGKTSVLSGSGETNQKFRSGHVTSMIHEPASSFDYPAFPQVLPSCQLNTLQLVLDACASGQPPARGEETVIAAAAPFPCLRTVPASPHLLFLQDKQPSPFHLTSEDVFSIPFVRAVSGFWVLTGLLRVIL